MPPDKNGGETETPNRYSTMGDESNKTADKGRASATCSACDDLLRAWDEAIEKWQVNHESIPAAFVGMAAVVDTIREFSEPNDPSAGTGEAR